MFVVYVFFFFLQDSLPVNHDINAKTGLPAYLIENEGHFFDSLMYSVRVLNPFVDLRQTKAISKKICWGLRDDWTKFP